ncbi:NADH-quinone oxidoreductase subunit N [Blastopirellula retiformator]|uniref:NADH-quinone oxidoreductase subunit N n=1 Tax=Blastopirellula retiformator TaxID=2527970 RepID=A0A5C5V5I0_9BACT|nr:NADH-quinone oxidoreductase subunit N [Blastopirellula retiformator]TWT33310.1 NADH-quinone oxidoreductase subunit N [Blastopirellula retiformator]
MFYQLIEQLRIDTLQQSLPLIGAELTLTFAILLILLCRMLPVLEKIDAVWLAIVGVVAALIALRPFQPWAVNAEGATTPVAMGDLQPTELFTGMLTHDGFAIAIKTLLLFFLLLFFVLTKVTRLAAKYDSTDFVVLALGSTLGMFMMVASNHMIMVFMGVEMASVPSYVMVALQRRNRKASEAALKYAVYGAGAAGVMLYGISLLCGVLNSAHLPTMATRLSEVLAADSGSSEILVLALGGLMLGVGLSFKLSAFPFHFWCPDVFEGATSEVNAFLSVASKAAALALLVRVAIGFTTLPAQPEQVARQDKPAVEQVVTDPSEVQLVNFVDAKQADDAKPTETLAPARKFVCLLVAVIAVATCTFGNLAAYAQTNIKRLLAYSTIAHAGYMMMAVPAAIAVAEVSQDSARQAIAYLALYAVIYLFMNLGAFAAVAFVREAVGSDEIKDYAGMLRRSPTLAICLTLILVSLIGLPPLAGFIGKFAIFAAIAQAWNQTSYPFLMLLLVAGGLNTAISLFYYLRIAKVMTIDGESDETAPMQKPIGMIQNGYLALVTAPLVLLMFNWDFLNAWLLEAVSHILT